MPIDFWVAKQQDSVQRMPAGLAGLDGTFKQLSDAVEHGAWVVHQPGVDECVVEDLFLRRGVGATHKKNPGSSRVQKQWAMNATAVDGLVCAQGSFFFLWIA